CEQVPLERGRDRGLRAGQLRGERMVCVPAVSRVVRISWKLLWDLSPRKREHGHRLTMEISGRTLCGHSTSDVMLPFLGSVPQVPLQSLALGWPTPSRSTMINLKDARSPGSQARPLPDPRSG